MFKEECSRRAALVESALVRLFENETVIAPRLYEAMRYSLLAGGKRLRPVLLMASAEAAGAKDGGIYMEAACALEMIHTYSLIHDDLPAMDDDAYRRGRLTNHKVFGEGVAILAGDALLTNAFEVLMRQKNADPSALLKAAAEISRAAGFNGMVGGQVIDLMSENTSIEFETLQVMHQAKTGALFRAAVRVGAILAGASEKTLEALTSYADKFGLAFQITDDILDVSGDQEKIGKPIGSDQKNHKSTYVTLYSLETAQKMALETVESAVNDLKAFGEEAEFLRLAVRYLIKRDH